MQEVDKHLNQETDRQITSKTERKKQREKDTARENWESTVA